MGVVAIIAESAAWKRGRKQNALAPLKSTSVKVLFQVFFYLHLRNARQLFSLAKTLCLESCPNVILRSVGPADEK